MVVLTHGEYDYFTGVDGNKVNLHRFLSSMNSRNAPKLAGKPKIFIMQACRGVPIDRPDALFNFHTKKQSEFQTRFSPNDRKHSLVDHSSFSLFSCIGLKSPATSAAIPPPTLISAPFPLPNTSPSTSTQSSTYCNRQHQSYNEQSPAKETVNESHPKGVEPDRKLYKVVKEPSDADMLICYATTPNYVSWRNSMNGTWFVQSICEVFSKHAANEDIVTMLTRVNKQVAHVYESSSTGAKQIPEMASRLRKKFYFFPGIDTE
uniref:Uncharacterized protein n=1 Tax=Ditylenchus dipsaci TaxID=166011 RepID=A0A915EKU0_9BILA